MKGELTGLERIRNEHKKSFSKIKNENNSNWPYLQAHKLFLSEIISWVETQKDLKFKKVLDDYLLYELANLDFEKYKFNIDWGNIEEEITSFFIQDLNNYEYFIAEYQYFLEFFLSYKSLLTCSCCELGELFVFKTDESIFYECKNCYSLYNESLTRVTELNRKIVFCDRKTLIERKILRIL
ncbi:hypothetical protein [Emticicia fluvialis]|uniref:hypothetical protein n=1 Tax=Emticicia fluvialis TaxID=2974474 RepID=UPI0021658BB4|nr:hypothetical protein [Emticicia fluvialis]